MARIFYRYIKIGEKTIDDVPKKLRDAVQALLDQDEEDPKWKK